jgi:sirohydrochlorin ferrochelatase
MRSARLIAPPPAGSDGLVVVLVAHGSRDPRAFAATSALTRAVQEAHPAWAVRAAVLDHDGPRPLDVLRTAGSRAVLVPLLLTSAYHGQVDVPAIVADAASLPVSVSLAEVLGAYTGAAGHEGPPRLLLDALARRLAPMTADAVVLAAAGTRNAEARVTIERAADALSDLLSVPCAVAYASAAPPAAGDAVRRLRAAGARRVAMGAYFLAPGLLYDNAVRSALAGGAVGAAEPLGDAPELVRLVADRVEAAISLNGRRPLSVTGARPGATLSGSSDRQATVRKPNRCIR